MLDGPVVRELTNLVLRLDSHAENDALGQKLLEEALGLGVALDPRDLDHRNITAPVEDCHALDVCTGNGPPSRTRK